MDNPRPEVIEWTGDSWEIPPYYKGYEIQGSSHVSGAPNLRTHVYKLKQDLSEDKQASTNQVGGVHYKSMPIQPIEFILANDIPYCEANVIKYICRWKNKNGMEDLEKAKHYIELLMEHTDGSQEEPTDN